MAFIEQLARHACEIGSHEAFAGDSLSMDYATLFRRVTAGATFLADHGINHTSVVALTLADEVEHMIATYALFAVGASHITAPSHEPAGPRLAPARLVGATHLLADAIEDTADGLGTVIWSAPPADGAAFELPARSGEARLLLKTSGTTGNINVVAFSGEQLAAQAGRLPDYAGERFLRLASVEYNNSKRHRLYCAFIGGTNLVWPRGSAATLAEFCARHRATCVDVSRMHAADLTLQADASGLAGIKLRPGGSMIPLDLRRRIERAVTRQLYVRYGTTEAGAISHAGPGEHDEDGSVGWPLPGVEVEIVDTDGLPLADGEVGSIRLRGAGMATGYVGENEQTAKRFRDGWFWPGDVGMRGTDGSLTVLGRQDDMISMNGIKVFPVEIERVLERHPSVGQAAALPVDSSVHGQIPVAAVELREGAAATPLELQAYAREHLALRAPRRILILPELPRNSAGKVMRVDLARAFARGGVRP